MPRAEAARAGASTLTWVTPTRETYAMRALLVITFLAHVAINRGLFGADRVGGAYVFNATFLLAAGACWLRSRARRRDRAAWLALAIGISSFVVGNAYFAHVLHYRVDGLSLADVFWLGFYVAIYAAIALFTKANVKDFLSSTWLDGAIGAFGAAAIAIAFFLAPALSFSSGRSTTVGITLMYPIAAIVMLMLVVCASHALRGQGPSWWMFAAGLMCFLIGEASYLYMTASGQPIGKAGNSFAIGWAGGVTLIGLTATIPERADQPRRQDVGRYFVPSFFGASAIALLLYGQRHTVPFWAIVFTTATLLLCAVRLLITTREVRRLSTSREEARTDYLTNLPNRRHLTERLAAEVARIDVPTSLLVIDLDRFKEVNDSLGHVAGDELLRQVADRLNAEMRGFGMLTRLGGDEFAVVLPAHNAHAATEVAGRLRARLWEPFRVADTPIAVHASIGVASVPEHGTSAPQLLAQADIAMYQAKRTETGVATFEAHHTNPSRDRLELLTDLHGALNQGQFVVHYQPQRDLHTGRTYGVEALVRWQHPRRGLLQPAEFMPIVIETRLMTSLTKTVLRQTLADRSRLREIGLPLRMSVNISAYDLSDPSLPDLIEDILDADDVEAGQLVLEITEDAVITDRLHSHAVLRRLRERGALVSVDDYGTGRASLAYLRDLPLDEIKLDQRFLVGIPADTHNAAIVRSTVELAHTLGLPLVAEGVESQVTLQWLESVGCDVAQGFFIGRPMNLAELEQWLLAGRHFYGEHVI